MRNLSMRTGRNTARPNQLVATALREPLRQGWEDMRRGLPFRPEYETMAEKQQLNYESGRLRALAVKESAMVPVEWHKPSKPGGTMKTPEAVQRQIKLATAFPGMWPSQKPMPEDPNLQFGQIMLPLRRTRRAA